MITAAETDALRRALSIARLGPVGVNPRVGCVVLDTAHNTVGEGWHEGAGTAHAEVAALAAAGAAARGGTAVVTLEPCDHTGRTSPCTEVLLTAGVRRVVYARRDRDAPAAGGADRLRAAGVDVELVQESPLRAEADSLVEIWQLGRDLARPVVTWKFATTLDGRSAAADGTSQWITSAPARLDVHARRAEADALLVGTGTALADDPLLTVRDADGAELPRQPMRAVMGLRALPPSARLLTSPSPTVLLRTRDPHDALAQLWRLGRRHVWLEGGPTLAAAFWRADLIDRVVAYVAPALLGAGRSSVGDLGIGSIADIGRLQLDDVALVGSDLRLLGRPEPHPTAQSDLVSQSQLVSHSDFVSQSYVTSSLASEGNF